MVQWAGSAIVQLMFGAEPLTEPMLIYCQLNTEEQIWLKFESIYKISIHANAFENVVC